jgi:hypothetical protein
MTTVFCSNKLEKLLGLIMENPSTDIGNAFGNWNGHLFTFDRKKNLIFMNDKTAYTFVLLNIKKADLKDFKNVFKESLINQLYNDLKISERQEIEVRKWISDIQLAKTNNNKKILGTMNDFVLTIKAIAYEQGGLTRMTNLSIGHGLNNYIIGTKLKGVKKSYSVPKELMENLLHKLLGS